MLAEVSIKISKAIFPIWIYNYNININNSHIIESATCVDMVYDHDVWWISFPWTFFSYLFQPVTHHALSYAIYKFIILLYNVQIIGNVWGEEIWRTCAKEEASDFEGKQNFSLTPLWISVTFVCFIWTPESRIKPVQIHKYVAG